MGNIKATRESTTVDDLNIEVSRGETFTVVKCIKPVTTNVLIVANLLRFLASLQSRCWYAILRIYFSARDVTLQMYTGSKEQCSSYL